MNLNDFTLTQLLLAAGKARGMTPAALAHHLDCSEAYYYKLQKDNDFLKLVEQLKGSDLDPDNVKFINVGTLQMDIGKYLYNIGQKTKIGEN